MKMVQIRAGVIASCRAVALQIQRPRIIGMARIAQIDLPRPREGLAMPSRAGRHDAVKHVDTARHSFEKIGRRPDNP